MKEIKPRRTAAPLPCPTRAALFARSRSCLRSPPATSSSALGGSSSALGGSSSALGGSSSALAAAAPIPPTRPRASAAALRTAARAPDSRPRSGQPPALRTGGGLCYCSSYSFLRQSPPLSHPCGGGGLCYCSTIDFLRQSPRLPTHAGQGGGCGYPVAGLRISSMLSSYHGQKECVQKSQNSVRSSGLDNN
jgi:hypothetical protein